MDEPLSALDRMTKEEILPYFELLHKSLALPIVYVSHDIGEVVRLRAELGWFDTDAEQLITHAEPAHA